MAELAGAATLLAGVARMAPKLLEYLEKNHKLRASLKNSIRYIEEECAMISALVQEYTDRHQKTGKGTHKVWISMVRELACEIDDAIDRFTHQIGVTPEPDAPWIRRAVHRDTTRNARNKFAAEILRLKEKSKQVYQLKEMYSDTSELDLAAPEAETWEYTASPVGMDAAHDELIELIRRAPHGQPDELKVISLVGFGGIGKTQLAKHAYNTIDTREYPVRVWVPAAKKGAQDVLKNILQQLGMYSTINTTGASSGGASSTSDDLRAAITRCLRTRRFFIVIDDISASIWNQISKAFDVVPQVGNRVIVTTTTQSIAKACSRYAGYVYVMRTLAKTESRELFCKEASLEYPPPGGAMHLCSASEEALTKCDGLPLALVTTAQFLQNKCNNEESWKFECGNLGPSLETDPLLASMKRVLVHGYTRLGSQDVKICLLYMGIYPNGHPIRRASLIRRWLAEGFITKGALAAASNNFDELINHSIIQPIDASSSNSAEVKTCQTHGMMLEFILNNTDNFVTLLDDKATRTSNVRWLSLNNRTDASSKLNSKDLCLVRSLTIFGKAHKSVLDFSKYELMRVLDLEECKHLKNKHLKEICSNLFLLRYPSLRGVASVTLLPKEIKKLQLLETLDLRETNIDILHARVIELPCLIRLFGKFKFQPGVGGRRMHKLQNWLLENSKLEMVAGFVVDKNQELTQLMNHMNLLTKLKIWCESTAEASSNLSHFSEAIKGFIQRGKIINSNIQIETGRQIETDTDSTTDSVTSFSLSLNFSGERSQDLLNFPLENGNYCLNSLKLQGNNIFSLPPFVTMLAGLTKLCLSFPHHQLSGDILAALSSIRGLKCLKLITIQLDNLVIGYDKLQSLKHLYVMVEVMNELEIQEGALPLLESLQLLCKELNGFSSTMIQSLPRLKEVTIHDGVSEETKQEWKGAAKNHSERPKLLFVKTKLMGSQLAEKISHEAATATGMTDEDVHVECEPAENSQSPAASLTAEVVTSEMVDNQMGSEPSAEISTVATAKDKTDEEDDVEGEHAEPPTDITLLMAMPPDAISTTMEGEYVQLNGVNDETKHEWQEAAKNHPSCPNLMIVQTKPIGNVAAAEIIPAAVATGTTVEEVYVEGEPAAETSLVATASDMTDGEVHVESESADDSQNPAAQLTVQLATLMVDDQMETGSKTTAEIQAALGSTDNMMLSVNHDAVTSGQQEYSAQVATC